MFEPNPNYQIQIKEMNNIQNWIHKVQMTRKRYNVCS